MSSNDPLNPFSSASAPVVLPSSDPQAARMLALSRQARAARGVWSSISTTTEKERADAETIEQMRKIAEELDIKHQKAIPRSQAAQEMEKMLRELSNAKADSLRATAVANDKKLQDVKRRAQEEARWSQVPVAELCEQLLDAVCGDQLPTVERILAAIGRRGFHDSARPLVEPTCHIAAIAAGSASTLARLFDMGFLASAHLQEFFPYLLAYPMDRNAAKSIALVLFEHGCGVNPGSAHQLARARTLLSPEQVSEAGSIYERWTLQRTLSAPATLSPSVLTEDAGAHSLPPADNGPCASRESRPLRL